MSFFFIFLLDSLFKLSCINYSLIITIIIEKDIEINDLDINIILTEDYDRS